MERKHTVALDDVYADIGLGRFHAYLFLVCGVGFAAAAIEVVLLAFLMTELRTRWSLTEYQLGMLSSVKDVGVLAGELIVGPLADYYGRRSTFIITLLIVVVFGAASALAPGIVSLTALRFGVGFGYGGCLVVDLTIFTEFLPTLNRGTMLFLFALFWPVGQLGTTALAWWLIPSFGWRFFVLICCLPSLVTVFLRPCIPESPRWLCSQGRMEEATEVCRELAIANGKLPKDVGILPNSQVTAVSESSQLQQECVEDPRFNDLFGLLGPKHRRTTLGLMGAALALNFSTYASQTFMPSYLEMKNLAQQSTYLTMVFDAILQFPGVLLAMLLSGRYGRLITMNLFMAGVAITTFFFACATDPSSSMLYSCALSFAVEGGYAVFHVYMSEVYETKLRATAGGMLEAFGTVSGGLVPFCVAFCLSTFTDTMSGIYVLAIVAAVGGFGTFVFLNIETLDRDLDDMGSAAPLKMITP